MFILPDFLFERKMLPYGSTFLVFGFSQRLLVGFPARAPFGMPFPKFRKKSFGFFLGLLTHGAGGTFVFGHNILLYRFFSFL